MGILPKSLGNSLEKVLDEPSNSVGKTLNDVWEICIGNRLSYLNVKSKAKYEKKTREFLDEISEKTSLIPEDKLLPPDMQIIGNVIEDSKLCLDVLELRNMFSNLVASSVNSDKRNKAHPAFTAIIKQLTARDASNLSLFAKNSGFPIAEYLTKRNEVCFSELSNVFLANEKYQDIQNQAISLALLEMLGLLNISFTISAYGANYDIFKGTKEFIELQERCNDSKGITLTTNQIKAISEFSSSIGSSVTANQFASMVSGKEEPLIRHGVVSNTPLGSAFIAACL